MDTRGTVRAQRSLPAWHRRMNNAGGANGCHSGLYTVGTRPCHLPSLCHSNESSRCCDLFSPHECLTSIAGREGGLGIVAAECQSAASICFATWEKLCRGNWRVRAKSEWVIDCRSLLNASRQKLYLTKLRLLRSEHPAGISPDIIIHKHLVVEVFKATQGSELYRGSRMGIDSKVR